jgi:outer membrane protein assembly factor BamB
VVAGLVCVATTSGALVALEADSGREVWRQRRGPILPLIVGASGSLVLTVLDGSLAALAADSGIPRWEVPIDAGERWAVLAGGTIHVAAGAAVTAIARGP